MNSLLYLVLCLSLACQLVVTVVAFDEQQEQEDQPFDFADRSLYDFLGVDTTATNEQIKDAFKARTKETHPDKVKLKGRDRAALKYEMEVYAFEILTNKQSREKYDESGIPVSSRPTSWKYRGFSEPGYDTDKEYFNTGHLHHKFEAKQAQSRVIHVSSLQHLKTVVLDPATGLLDKNVLICLSTPKLETLVNDYIVFPYPFAGIVETGVWWDSLVLPIKVIVDTNINKAADAIVKHFGIEELTEPTFIFGEKNQELLSTFPRLSTKVRKLYQEWVKLHMEQIVQIVNQHPHPVEVFWSHSGGVLPVMKLQPGETSNEMKTMVSQEWLVRDARVDTHQEGKPDRSKLTEFTMLNRFKVTGNERYKKFIIEPKTCFDLSGHCIFYEPGECDRNPTYMNQYCRRTCSICSEEDDLVGKKESLDSSTNTRTEL